jgi:hypothetical protein
VPISCIAILRLPVTLFQTEADGVDHLTHGDVEQDLLCWPQLVEGRQISGLGDHQHSRAWSGVQQPRGHLRVNRVLNLAHEHVGSDRGDLGDRTCMTSTICMSCSRATAWLRMSRSFGLMLISATRIIRTIPPHHPADSHSRKWLKGCELDGQTGSSAGWTSKDDLGFIEA